MLSELVRCPPQHTYSMRELVWGALSIGNQLSTIALFTVVFLECLWRTVDINVLMLMNALLMFVGSYLRNESISSASGSLLFVGTLQIAAPVLRTLTESYSDDTICSLSALLFFVHLFLQDYSYLNNQKSIFEGTVSLNAAIFASLLMASRLQSNEHVFSLTFFAFELFGYFPMARHNLKKLSPFGFTLSSLGACLFCSWRMMVISSIASISYIVTFRSFHIIFSSQLNLINS